jgi:hypothetical protein
MDGVGVQTGWILKRGGGAACRTRRGSRQATMQDSTPLHAPASGLGGQGRASLALPVPCERRSCSRTERTRCCMMLPAPPPLLSGPQWLVRRPALLLIALEHPYPQGSGCLPQRPRIQQSERCVSAVQGPTLNARPRATHSVHMLLEKGTYNHRNTNPGRARHKAPRIVPRSRASSASFPRLRGWLWAEPDPLIVTTNPEQPIRPSEPR